jgi:hypothetical protein
VGVVVRLVNFWVAPGFWMDEARIALEIGTRTPGGLLDQLDYGQVAPPLFLLLEKGLFVLSGGRDWALRLLPFAASVLALAIALPLARRMLPVVPALVAGALFALTPALVVFTWQLKPYSVDVLIAASVLALGVHICQPERPPGLVNWLGVVGLVAVLISVPAPFVLATVGATVLLSRWKESHVRRSLTAWSAAWAGLFGFLALMVYPKTGPGTYLYDYWRTEFLDLFHPLQQGRLFLSLLNGWFLHNDVTLPAFKLVAICLLLLGLSGVIWFFRRRDVTMLALLGGPLCLVVIASILERWPIADRLLLFTLPSVILLLSAGVELLRRSRGGMIAMVAGLAVLLAWPAFVTGQMTFLRRYSGERQASGFAQHYGGPDPVYVSPRALPTWLYYSTDWSAPDIGRLVVAARAGSPGGPSAMPWWRSPGNSDSVPPAPHQGAHYQELWGAASIRMRTPDDDQHPIPGWAASEAERIAALGSESVRLFMWGTSRAERQALYRALSARGGSMEDGGLLLGRVSFDRTGPIQPKSSSSRKPGRTAP